MNLIFVLFVATHTNYQTEEQYFRGGAAATEANQWRGSALLYTVTNQNRRGSGKPPRQLSTITAPSCPKIQKLSVHLFFLYPFHIQSFLSLSFSVIKTSMEISHTHSLQFLYISYPLFSLSYHILTFLLSVLSLFQTFEAKNYLLNWRCLWCYCREIAGPIVTW